MINKNDIDTVLAASNIVDIVAQTVKLKRTGSNYTGLCPFHNEKTPSFSVSETKQIFKCFGCGKGGNVFAYIMQRDNITFPEAIKQVAKHYNITINEEQPSEAEQQQQMERESVYNCLNWATKLFHQQLINLPTEHETMKYALSRWSMEDIKLYELGLSLDSDAFFRAATAGNWTAEQLKKAGLLPAYTKDKIYPVFINRLMIPMKDRLGRVIAFTGRDMTGNYSKYKNSPETIVYRKGDYLFGIDTAQTAICKNKTAIIVEGNADCIKLQSLGIENVVATCGTSLTQHQITLLSRAEKFVIVGDSDTAGDKAVVNSSEKLIENGKTVKVIPLPVITDNDTNERKKIDPDSFFTSKEQFEQYALKNRQDFILWHFSNELQKYSDEPIKISCLITNICKLLSNYKDNEAQEYIKALSKIYGPIAQWKKTLNTIDKDRDKDRGKEIDLSDQEVEFVLPEGVDKDIFFKYGFFEKNNCYFFRRGEASYKGSNFIIKPISHIESISNSKRVYQMTNEHGHTRVIEMSQEDLVSVNRFRQRVESLGNFLFRADFPQLMIIKSYLYECTITCQEITQLGHNKRNFYAWGNGITYQNKFIQSDSYGIVQLPIGNFYLPAFSRIYEDEHGLFQYERRFVYKPGKITMPELYCKMIDVFGDSAIVGIAFVLSTMFKDIITISTKLPILNLFGPKGSGKTKLAYVLLQFFGHLPEGNNINNTSRAALADDVSRVSNALVHIEEYKNMIEPEKIEFLKGLWDGRGRTRMNMDKDKKSETTATDSGIVLSGQEMPTADIALYSRLVALTFTTAERDDASRKKFDELMQTAECGFSHLTHNILNFRDIVQARYSDEFKALTRQITDRMAGTTIEDRIFFNWVSIFSTFNILKDLLSLPTPTEKIIDVIITKMKQQNAEVRQGGEVAVFWRIVEYLHADEKIAELFDFKIKTVNELKTDANNYQFPKPKRILYIQHARIFQLYRESGKRTGENILPINTLEYYLKHSKEYLGKIMSERFRTPDTIIDTTISQDGVPRNISGAKNSKITKALAFDYEMLDINIDSFVESTVND